MTKITNYTRLILASYSVLQSQAWLIKFESLPQYDVYENWHEI
ncbi:MAG: hypothetical protein ACUVRP_11160 [Chlorobiales bacterium]